MRILIFKVLFGLLLCFALAGYSEAQSPDVSYRQTEDVVYGEDHGTGLLMDVFRPKEKSNGLAIVDVASGAWYSDRGKIRDHERAQIFQILCGKGYTVFAVRPGSKTRYSVPEMDRHVKIGIRFIKKHAGDYGIDSGRLGLTGASAGGHLATLAALTSESRPLDADSDTKVAAVAVFFPPTDFLAWKENLPPDPSFLKSLLSIPPGDQPSEQQLLEQAKEISPLFAVGQPKIPFLFIHGDADPLVPLSHSEKIVQAIQAAGGNAKLIVKPGGGHPWPTIAEEVQVMADWFDEQLKPTANE